MGHQIRAGKDGVHWTDGAWQIVDWCNHFTPQTKPDGMTDDEWWDRIQGNTYIPSASVKRANELVPHAYEAAAQQGLIRKRRHGGDLIGADEFVHLRLFLADAAVGGHDINGSY